LKILKFIRNSDIDYFDKIYIDELYNDCLNAAQLSFNNYKIDVNTRFDGD